MLHKAFFPIYFVISLHISYTSSSPGSSSVSITLSAYIPAILPSSDLLPCAFLPGHPKIIKTTHLWRTLLHVGGMIFVLVFANWTAPQTEHRVWQVIYDIKWYIAGFFLFATILFSMFLFNAEEREAWLRSTWDYALMVLPLHRSPSSQGGTARFYRDKIMINIDADDSTSFRASVNSAIKWIKLALEINTLTD